LIPVFAARPRGPSAAAAALCLAAIAVAAPIRSQGAAAPLSIDGIVALVGSAPGDEGAATPLLASDVALHAALGALLEGARTRPPDADLGRARRQAILLALLVRDARLSGEEVDAAAWKAIVDTITANAGGPDAFAAMLASLGATPGDAVIWAGDVALAAAQVTYMREQIEPPSDKDVQRRFAAAGHPFVGRDFKDVKDRLRELMIDEQLVVALGALLGQALREGAVRFVRP
jgi:hypothetical protein